MAESIQITANPRSELGSRANRRLRAAGCIPAVVYGHKEAVVPVTLPDKQIVTHLEHGAHVFDLSMNGQSEKVLVKDVQYDHLGMEILHVDFARVSLDERVQVTVPLELRGTPKGEDDGGVLQQVINELEIECIVTDIPSEIRHNIADMGLDSVLHISDIQLPPGIRCLQDAELIVATVREVVEAEPAEEAETGAAEPEVIGRKAEDEEGAEDKEEK
jgi:large subunit ribosomal protein L25